MIVDELRTANWQRSKDGTKNRNRPKRISPLARKPGIRYGRTSRPTEEVIAYLDRLHGRQVSSNG